MADDDWAPPFKVHSDTITFDSEGVTLSATLWERERKPVVVPEGKKAPKIKEGAPEAPPRAWCILVHGLLSDRNEFGDLGEHLAKQGYGVLALDVRGHGKSGGPRGLYDVEATVRDVQAAQAFLEARCLDWEYTQWDHAPQQWAVIGHSAGGIVALRAGHYLHAGDVVVAASTPRSFREQMNPFKRLGYKLAYTMSGKQNGDKAGPTVKYPVTYKDIFVDRAAMESAKAKGFLQTRIPLANYPLLMELDAAAIAYEVQDPTVLMMAGSKDKVVSPSATKRVFDACSSAKTWYDVDGSGHSVFLDAQRAKVREYLTDWLGERLGAFNEVRAGHTKR